MSRVNMACMAIVLISQAFFLYDAQTKLQRSFDRETQEIGIIDNLREINAQLMSACATSVRYNRP